MAKTQLPYLLQEALSTGNWQLEALNKNNEKYVRGEASIEIGTTPLRGTDPVSYVFRMQVGDAYINKAEKLNDLCARLAKKNS